MFPILSYSTTVSQVKRLFTNDEPKREKTEALFIHHHRIRLYGLRKTMKPSDTIAGVLADTQTGSYEIIQTRCRRDSLLSPHNQRQSREPLGGNLLLKLQHFIWSELFH
jgi:hypothetical protein